MAAPLQVKKGACRVLCAESSPGRALEVAVQLDAALVRVFVRVVCAATEPLETPWMTTRYLAFDAFWIPDDGFRIFSRLRGALRADADPPFGMFVASIGVRVVT